MKMVRKIAITASTLLFVLAQFLSGYLIHQNYEEKIILMEEKETELLEIAIKRLTQELNTNVTMNAANDTVYQSMLVTEFRRKMLQNSALYCENKSVCNNTEFQFENIEIKEIDLENYYNTYTQRVRLSEKRYVLFYNYEVIREKNYVFYHMLDVTDIYNRSMMLVRQELVVTVLMAVLMAFLLYILIQRITKPLKNTNELQQQFIGGMAHEMRTPLTAMKGYSQTILDVNISREQERKALNYINSECDRLSRLTEKMAELTRLYQTKQQIEQKEIDIRQLFLQVEQALSHSIQEKELILLREGRPEAFQKEGDLDLLTELLINLGNNAAVASEYGKRIWLGADEKSIWVRDEGSGIPQIELENVKKAFYRVDKSRSRKSGNMGLGLSICERIAQLHRGNLKIESQLGVGTKITLEIR